MSLTWWQVIVPAVTVALAVRWHATQVADWYFAWVDLFDQISYEPSERPPSALWQAFLGRMSAPFAVGLALGAAAPQVYGPVEGATLGALGGLLVLWPMVFHGIPQRLKMTDWLIYVVYGSFVLSAAGAAALGTVAGEALRNPATLVEQAALALAFLLLTSVVVYIYNAAARQLGRQLERRSGGIDYSDDGE